MLEGRLMDQLTSMFQLPMFLLITYSSYFVEIYSSVSL